MIIICPNCGSDEIQYKDWIDANTDTVVDDMDISDVQLLSSTKEWRCEICNSTEPGVDIIDFIEKKSTACIEWLEKNRFSTSFY